MENQPLLEKEITIEELSNTTLKNGSVVFKIKSGKEKFGLWKNKKDGTESKAYQYLKTLGFEAVGKTVAILYKEEPDTFTDDKGKTVNYIRRTIVGMGLPKAKPLLAPEDKQELAKMSETLAKQSEDVPTKEELASIPF